MNLKAVGLSAWAAIFLVSCSGGGPSNKDIKRAFQDNIDSVSGALLGGDAYGLGDNFSISIKNTACKKQDAGRYQCSFSMTMDNPITGKQTFEQTGVFVKRDGRWHPANSY